MAAARFSRRSFLAIGAAAPLALARSGKIPVGLELYSVRKELATDLMGTVRKVAGMGYECVEFYAPYLKWDAARAKQVRKLLDELGVKCFSTHNSSSAFEGDGLDHAIELNKIIGSKYIVMASPGRIEGGLDNWKRVAEKVAKAQEKMKAAGLTAGYHNHRREFEPVEGKRPIEVIAANTPKEVMLQLDVGTCLEAGADPVAWIRANPGRIKNMHCKDWSSKEGKGYKVLFGEGDAPWKEIFQAAESVGGIEYYLIEQEGSAYPPFETVERCLANFKKIHG